jgi:hypothetical protein
MTTTPVAPHPITLHTPGATHRRVHRFRYPPTGLLDEEPPSQRLQCRHPWAIFPSRNLISMLLDGAGCILGDWRVIPSQTQPNPYGYIVHRDSSHTWAIVGRDTHPFRWHLTVDLPITTKPHVNNNEALRTPCTPHEQHAAISACASIPGRSPLREHARAVKHHQMNAVKATGKQLGTRGMGQYRSCFPVDPERTHA